MEILSLWRFAYENVPVKTVEILVHGGILPGAGFFVEFFSGETYLGAKLVAREKSPISD